MFMPVGPWCTVGLNSPQFQHHPHKVLGKVQQDGGHNLLDTEEKLRVCGGHLLISIPARNSIIALEPRQWHRILRACFPDE